MNRTLALFFITFLACVLPIASYAAKRDMPLPVVLTLNEVNNLLTQEKTDEAIAVLEGFKSKSPYSDEEALNKPDPRGYRHHLIMFMLGNCYLIQQRNSEAIKALEWVTTKKPDYFQAWSNLAKAYFDTEQFDNAANAFTRAYLLESPRNPEYLYYAAAALLSNERPQDSLKVFKRILRYHPAEMKLEWQKTLVSVYFSVELYQEAFPFIEDIISKETGKERRKWQEILLGQYIQLEMRTRAIEYAEHLVTIDPIHADWWKSLAYLELEEGLYEETLSALMIYAALTPPTLKEQKLMATLCLSLDIPIQSAKIYEDIAREEINKDTINGLAQSYSRLYKPAKVIRWIDVGLKQFENTELRLLKANLLFGMDRYQEAVTEYTTITNNDPDKGDAWLMLGYTYLNLKNTTAAKKAFETARNFPNQEKSANDALSHISRKNTSAN